MRRSRPLGLTAVIATVAGLATGLTPAQGAAAEQIVKYHGYQVAVPAGWQIVDLAKDPSACVRFDRPAVYLGHVGEQPNCPAHLVGRTAGLHIEALDRQATVTADTAETAAGQAVQHSAKSVGGEIKVAVEDAGVLVTAVHAPEQEKVVRDVLGKAKLASGGSRVELVRPAPVRTAAAPIVAPGNLLGEAFDACTAPSLGAMNAWRSSPFKAVGIYISGSVRACGQANLTPSWVAANYSNGWQFILIDVGRQAPCTTYATKMSSDPATARQQGRDAAAASAQSAINLGFGGGSAIYSDIENYPSNASCKAAVLSYVSGWTQELNARGFLGGVYTSAGSGGVDLSSGVGDSRYTPPDHIWFAWWNGLANTDGGRYIPAGLWVNHQRLHQYRGDHNETWGGVTINIDSNFVDVGTPTPPPPMSDGIYRIKAEVGGFDLDVTDCQSQDGADVRMWDRIAGSPCQKWHVTSTGSPNVFKIYDGHTGKPLTTQGCATADVTPVTLWTETNTPCETWLIEPLAGGAYKVINSASGTSLDVAGCSASRGADVILWPFHGGSCQRWYFSPA
ncbi:glycoside hydrolase domain-containing protein [Kribbella deserti]|uniref:Glycoside hydrolase domain-containing protein n=1 Tax=Kribbella deserti TaxID=1926257 RepID=A0ABV6QIN8_9ACTN